MKHHTSAKTGQVGVKLSRRLMILIFIFFGASANNAYSACSVTTNAVAASFGNVSSNSIDTPVTTSISDSGISCKGPFLGLLVTGDRAEATVQSLNQGTLKNSTSGQSIPYSLFADAVYSETVTPGQPYNFYNDYILGLLGLFGGGSSAFSLYLKTHAGSYNLSAGVYSDTLTVAWDWSICDAGTLFICLSRDQGSSTTVIDLQLTITKDCVINAPSIDFGNAPLVSGFSDVVQSITIRCSKDATYSVGLNNGSHADGSNRRMQSNGNYLLYEIYKYAAGIERWGSLGGERRDSIDAELNGGLHNGLAEQEFTLRAQILSTQPTPAVGTYSDSIIIDITF